MKISKTYLENLLEKKIIPQSAWSSKYINEKLCYMIKNEIYCKIFWLDYWFNEISIKFKNQNMINSIKNQDLTLPVIISTDLEFINVPKIIANIDYYSQPRITNTPFYINISLNFVFILSIVIFAIIIFTTIVFAKNSIYTMAV
ncbi:PIF-6 [Aratus pisonii nudivirus]|nr:PIF-6 [Aratus pisonii nudivirus]